MSQIDQVAPARHETGTGAADSRPDVLDDIVSQRTRDLIRKRRFGRTHRRGWVMKRALAAADIAGLTLAFLLARTLLDAPVQSRYDTVIPAVETLLLAKHLEDEHIEVHPLLSGLITHAEVDKAAAASETWKLVGFWGGLLDR